MASAPTVPEQYREPFYLDVLQSGEMFFISPNDLMMDLQHHLYVVGSPRLDARPYNGYNIGIQSVHNEIHIIIPSGLYHTWRPQAIPSLNMLVSCIHAPEQETQ